MTEHVTTPPRRIRLDAAWDGEAGVWWAESPDVPGLVTEAPTLDALAERAALVVPDVVDLPPAGAILEVRAIREHAVGPAAAA